MTTKKDNSKHLEAIGNDLLSHPETYARTVLSTLKGTENAFGNYILSQQRKEMITESAGGKDVLKKLSKVQKEDLEYFTKNFNV